MPTKVVLLTVVKRWKERKMPQIKGQIKPMMNAISVGSTNTGQYLLMAFCMIYLQNKGRRANSSPASHYGLHK